MSFFKRLSTGFKSPAEPSTSPDPQSASESNQAAASTVSDSPQPPAAAEPSTSPDSQFASESNQAAASRVSDSPQTPAAVEKTSPFEFWKSNLTVQSVDDAKSKLLDLNAKDPYGEPALIRAARHGDTTVIMALLAAGADIDSTDNSGETAMSWAAQMGKTEVLKILLDRPDVHIDKSDKGGRTALYDACCCQFSNVECVELLLERGAQPNDDMLHAAFDEARLGCLLKKIEPKEITTFLHSCIRSKGFVDPVLDKHRILPASRQLQSPSSTHSDPITVAKQANAIQSPSVRRSQQHQFILEDWIKRAGNANCPDANGTTLLMNACGKANVNAVKVLMKNGADVNAQDVNGRFAIHYAAQRFHPSTLKAMLIAEKIFDATQNRAINYRDKRGTTPFMLACRKGHIDAINMLIDRAKLAGVLDEVLEATDNRGFNVLHHASENLLSSVIRHLLSSYPQLKKILNSRTTPLGRVDRKDATPLHLAIMASIKGAGGLETCITLADFGCCLRERNLDGYTGLELLEKLNKTNNELGQWALMQDRAEQGGAANVKQQFKLATWLLESCSVRSICGSSSAKRWLEAAAQGGDKHAADKLAELSF